MKKIKYQTKYVLYHTGIMMLIIFITIGCFYQFVVDEMKDKEEQNFKVIAEKTATQLDSLFYDMDRTALQIGANPDIVNIFRTLENAPENYFTNDPVVKGEVKKLLESYNFKNDAHSRVCLYNKYNDFVCTSNRAVTDEGIQLFFKSYVFDSVLNFFKENDKYVYFRNPEIDVLASGEKDTTDYIAVVREIKDYFSNSNRCGFVEVQESTEKLDKILEDYGAGISIELMDIDNHIVYKNFKQEKIEKNKLDMIEISLINAPYTLKFYQNPVEYGKAIKQFYVVLALGVIVIMLVAVLLERILVKHLSVPLINLDNSLKSITMDNLHVDIVDDDSTDIVRRLEDSFNTMLKKLNDSMKNQITAKTNEVKSHFFALQSQMNPHFLHNILAIISMESQIDGNEKIPDICKRLGDILRYNSQMGNGYSTIGKECSITEDYMLLMKVRYEELFEYTIRIDNHAENICIPKLILQPLCENCFKHGFKNAEPIWKIDIHAWIEEKKWFITVKDNGIGFSKEYLENFQKEKENLDNTEIGDILENMSIGGLCLPNIYTRMKIEYGNSFVFELYNENDGAVVFLGGELDDTSFNS